MEEKKNPWLLLMLMLMGGAVVGGTFLWMGLGISLKNAGPEFLLPMLLIVGVIVLMVTLSLVSVAFSLLNLTDKSQALALPEGSVRAVIALMLLIVFAIVAIFLYINVSNSGKLKIADKLTATEVVELRKHVTIVFTLPPFVEPGTPQAAQPQAGQQQGGAQPAAQAYTVYYRDLSSPAGDDIAKQLIVLLGTLVTAVASFYFGSSTVSSARDAADRALRGTGGPSATAVDPNTLKPDGTSQALTITGTNLENVAAVELRSAEGEPLRADGGSVKPSATGVACTVTVPANTQAGPWDVVVSDNANNASTVPKAVTIKA